MIKFADVSCELRIVYNNGDGILVETFDNEFVVSSILGNIDDRK